MPRDGCPGCRRGKVSTPTAIEDAGGKRGCSFCWRDGARTESARKRYMRIAHSRWTTSASKLLMDQLGIETAIPSEAAPDASNVTRQASYDLARKLNPYKTKPGIKISTDSASSLAYQVLWTPRLLAELRYGLDMLQAERTILFKRCGEFSTYPNQPASSLSGRS